MTTVLPGSFRSWSNQFSYSNLIRTLPGACCNTANVVAASQEMLNRTTTNPLERIAKIARPANVTQSARVIPLKTKRRRFYERWVPLNNNQRAAAHIMQLPGKAQRQLILPSQNSSMEQIGIYRQTRLTHPAPKTLFARPHCTSKSAHSCTLIRCHSKPIQQRQLLKVLKLFFHFASPIYYFISLFIQTGHTMRRSLNSLFFSTLLALAVVTGCGPDNSLTVTDPPQMTDEELAELAREQSEHYSKQQ